MPRFDRLFPAAARPAGPRVPEFDGAAAAGASYASTGNRPTAVRFRTD